jgi:hypothetical protein
MTLSAEGRHYLNSRGELTEQEALLLEHVFSEIYKKSRWLNVPAAKDDRAAELEGSLVRFIIESRKTEAV